MPIYVGFSTINSNKSKSTNKTEGVDGGTGRINSPMIFGKKFRLVDEPLVIQDFVNSLNIQQGQKVGNPGYGSSIWGFLYEPNNPETQMKLQQEIQRIASLDPRIILNDIKVYPEENGILVEVELAVAPLNNPQTLSVFFNNLTNTVSLQ